MASEREPVSGPSRGVSGHLYVRPANGNGDVDVGPPIDADRGDWRDVCALDDILPGTGAAALISGVQVAVVRMTDGATIYAVGNFDPFSKAQVIARGIVGDRAGIPKIASPIFKQTFDLRSGVCLEDPSVTLPHWPARVRTMNGEPRVEICFDRVGEVT